MNSFVSWSVILVFAVYFVYGGKVLSNKLPIIRVYDTYRIFYGDENICKKVSVGHLPSEFNYELGFVTWKNDTIVFLEEDGCYQLYSSQGQKRKLCKKELSKGCLDEGQVSEHQCDSLYSDTFYLTISCKFKQRTEGSIVYIPYLKPDRE